MRRRSSGKSFFLPPSPSSIVMNMTGVSGEVMNNSNAPPDIQSEAQLADDDVQSFFLFYLRGDDDE